MSLINILINNILLLSGQKFAMMELKVVLSTIIRFVKIESVTKPEDIKVFPFVILRNNKAVLIKCELRRRNQEM